MSDKPYVPLNAATYKAVQERQLRDAARRSAKYARSEHLSSPPGRGYACARPFLRENPETGVVNQLQCGKCRQCIARRKNYAAGRLMAEANFALNVQMLTLTFDNEHVGSWQKPQLKLTKKWIRDECARQSLAAPAFYCVAELGELRGRKHYHLLLFWDGPTPFSQTPLEPDGKVGRETWKGWPCGFVQFKDIRRDGQNLPGAANHCRYVAKYVIKAERAAGVPSPSMSSRVGLDEWGEKVGKSLGYRCAVHHGKSYAQAGLPLSNIMRIDGFMGSNGQFQHFELKGSLARAACKAYREKWDELYPGKEINTRLNESVLRRLHCPDYVDAAIADPRPRGREPERAEPKKKVMPPRPVLPERDCSGFLFVRDRRGLAFASLEMKKDGYVWLEVEGERYLMPGARPRWADGTFAVANGSVRAVLDVDEAAHEAIEAWIAEKRGPGWLELMAWKLECAEVIAARDAAIAAITHAVSQLGRAARVKAQVSEVLVRELAAYWAGDLPCRSPPRLRAGGLF